MKIVAVETLCLSRMHDLDEQWVTNRYRVVKADAAITLIRTDDGLTGIGEATPYGAPLLIRAEAARIGGALLGADPLTAQLPPVPPRRPQAADFPHTPPFEAARAGLDTALWDLRAQHAGQPLNRFINPAAADRLRLYASTGVRYDWRVRPADLIDDVAAQAAAGFTAAKIRIGTDWEWDGVTTDRFIALLRELRQTIGPAMELMLDGNMRLDFDQALAIGRELERLDFRWFEEPIPLEPGSYARLSGLLDIPVSGGEGAGDFAQLAPYIQGRCLDIIQPDVAVCGITDALRIAEAAAAKGIETCPHNWHNDLMTVANGHFLAAIGGTRPLERCRVQGPLQTALLAEPLAIAGGQFDLPRAPGLGVRLAEGLAARFPHVEGHYALQVPR